MNVYRKLRKLRGLSQEKAAQLLGVSVLTWRMWEKNKVAPSSMGVDKIVAGFRDELEQLKPLWYISYKRNHSAQPV